MGRGLIFLISLLVFLILACPGWALTEIDSCQTLSSYGETYQLNQSVNTSGTCFTVNNDSITLDCAGYNITGDGGASDYGIYLNGRSNVTVKNCTTVNFGGGIYVQSSSSNTLISNTAKNSASGFGIIFMFSSNNTLIHNTVSNNQWGIRNTFGSNNTLTNNTVTNHTADAITIEGGSSNNITLNTVNNSAGFGIYFDGSNSNTIASNTFTNNRYGITLDGGSASNNVTNNTVTNTTFYGLWVISGSNTFTNNTLSNHTFAAVTWDVYVIGSNNNFYSNIVSSYPTTFSFNQYSGGLKIKGVGSPPADPAGLANISRYLNITNASAGAWVYLNISYAGSDITYVREPTLKMYRHNGTEWLLIAGSSVDAADNIVHANLTEFSIFAPLSSSTFPMPISGTLYVPAIDVDDGWDTRMQIQGIDGSGTVNAYFWNESGAQIGQASMPVPSDGVWTLRGSIPSGAKSAIIYAAAGQLIAADVSRWKGGNYSNYPALPEHWLGLTSYEYYLPIVHKEHNDSTSKIIIQNTDTANASVRLDYLDEGGSITDTQNINISPKNTSRISLSDVSGLPSGWHGSVAVSSDKSLAIVVDKSSELSSYAGFSEDRALTSSYALFDHRESGDFNTTVWVQNPGAASDADVSFFDAGGNLLQTISKNIPANASAGFEMNASNKQGFWVGYVKVQSDNPVAAVVETDDFINHSFAWGTGLPERYNDVEYALPYIAKTASFGTRLVVANLNPNPGYTNLTVNIHDETGTVAFDIPLRLGPNQTIALNMNEMDHIFTGFVGCAKIAAAGTSQEGSPSIMAAYTYPEHLALPVLPDVTGTEDAMAYEGIPNSSTGTTAHIPAIDVNTSTGATTKITVQNTGGDDTGIIVFVWPAWSCEGPSGPCSAEPGPIDVYCHSLGGYATWSLEDINESAKSGIAYSVDIANYSGACTAAESVSTKAAWATWVTNYHGAHPGERIAATVTRNKTQGKSSYIAQPAEMLGDSANYGYFIFPVHHGYRAKNSTIMIQNAGDDTAFIWLFYKEEDDENIQKSQPIETLYAGESVRVGIGAGIDVNFPSPEIDAPWSGSVYILAQQPLAVTADDQNTLATYNSVAYDRAELGIEGTELYAPLFFRETGNWTAIVTVTDMTTTSEPASVMVEFLDEQGDIIRIRYHTIPRNTVYSFNLSGPDNTAYGIGAVRIRSVDSTQIGSLTPAQPISAVIALENPATNEVMVYNALSQNKTRYNKIFLPELEKRSQLTITDFDPVLSNTTNVTIAFYSEDGSLLHNMSLMLDDMVTRLGLPGITGLPSDYRGSGVISIGGSSVGAVASYPLPILSPSLVSPTSDTSVQVGSSFTFTSRATCQGSCGDVYAWLDPQPLTLAQPIQGVNAWVLALFLVVFIMVSGLSLKLQTRLWPRLVSVVLCWVVLAGLFVAGSITGLMGGALVPTTPGARPFYTTDSNPQSCGVMGEGDTCTNAWTVHVSGPPGTSHEFFVLYNSTLVSSATDSVTITIALPPEAGCSISWECREWGPCRPEGTQERVCYNTGTCRLPDKTETQDCVYTPPPAAPLTEGSASIGLGIGDTFVVQVAGVQHMVTVTEVTEETVTIRIASDPIEVTLREGETREVDVDGDGINDLAVSLLEITEEGGEFTFEILEAPAPTCSDGILNQGEEGIDCGGPCPACPVEVPAPVVPAWLFWAVMAAALVAVLGIISRAPRPSEEKVAY